MRNKIKCFAHFMSGETPSPRSVSPAAMVLAALFALTVPAGAQDSPDERRCTGQWRATVDERIAACAALIESGRYQPLNLAILHHNRGAAMRAKGDLAGAIAEFAEAIKLNPDYARAYADRGSVRLTQHDLDDIHEKMKSEAEAAGGVAGAAVRLRIVAPAA